MHVALRRDSGCIIQGKRIEIDIVRPPIGAVVVFQVGFLAWNGTRSPPISNRIEMRWLSTGLVLPTPRTNLSFAEVPVSASQLPVWK